ncbi:MAG: histidinol dehydrogenase [Acidobacteria bacterium]|nr:histidinol dehydrogenase [Acidobacteriota bacterium]
MYGPPGHQPGQLSYQTAGNQPVAGADGETTVVIEILAAVAAEQFIEEHRSGNRTSRKLAERSVDKTLRDVRKRRDLAVMDATALFDGSQLRPEEFRIQKDYLKELARKADPSWLKALRKAAANIRAFHQRQMEKSWKTGSGDCFLGQIIRPLHAVGVYVPGGKAAYPSTLLMNVIPAQIAGVKRIVVVSPPASFESHPALAAACLEMDVTEVYRVGGAQAIAALAYGTETIPQVDKIVGPGNIFVALAKRKVFGQVDIDMIAGPTEVVVIADDDAPPAYVAADMLAQAEHDEQAVAVCITMSEVLARQVVRQLRQQVRKLARRQTVNRALEEQGAILLAESPEQTISWANQLAPEHLQLMVRGEKPYLEGIVNAGAIFIGIHTPEPVGDYWAGPNHVLPTGGTARYSSPLGVYDFLKRTGVIKYSRRQLKAASPYIQQLALAEGLQAHARAVAVRFEKGTP